MFNSTGTPLRRSTDGRAVGHIVNGILHKRVHTSKHRYWALNAWTLDAKSYRQARNLIHSIHFFDEDDGAVYIVDAEIMDVYGQTIHHRGHGEQIALSLKHWHKEPRAEQRQLQLPLGL